MRTKLRNILPLLGLLGFGCGGTGVSPPVPRAEIGPHQATLYQLPENQGWVELVNEPEVEDRRVKPNTAVVVYFFQADRKTPLAPAPSDVRVDVNEGRNHIETLTLKAEPKVDDPAGGCRFASKLGPYLLEGLRGKLTATLNGKPVAQDFVAGR